MLPHKLKQMRTGSAGTRRWPAAAAAMLAAAVLASIGAGTATADDVSDFQGSWVAPALQLQYDLGSDVALKNAPLLGTHNSFNSVQEMGPGLSLAAINQRHDLTDQLDTGIRSLELDLHPEPNGNGSDTRPVVCHTLPQEGCTVVKDLDPFLSEIGEWLREPDNSEQVVLLYLEDDLDGRDLHDAAAKMIDDRLGDLVYAPQGQGCSEVPYDLTRDDVLATGKQLVIVSGCGKGSAWQSLAYSWEQHRESRPRGFEDFPACGPDYRIHEYQSNLIRYYEDSTSPNVDDGIDPETAAAMQRCGVDLVSFDRLEPLDGRLESSVWSWAPEEPSAGRCALIRSGAKLPYGRWVSKPCDSLQARPACRSRAKWTVGPKRVDPHEAVRYCRRRGTKLAVPRTGYENQLLRLAMEERNTRSALLGYRLRGGEWVPLDPRE